MTEKTDCCNKTTIRFDSSENSIQKLKVNETDVTHGTSKAYNRGETIKLEYSVPATYKFAGWKLTPATNAYTATPSGYVTSGTITVSKASKTYFTLKVDESNPAKAIVQIADAISLRVTHSSPVFFLKKAINALCTSSRSTLFLIAMVKIL